MMRPWLVLVIVLLLLMLVVQVVFSALGLAFKIVWAVLSKWYIILPIVVIGYFYLGYDKKRKRRNKRGVNVEILGDSEFVDEDRK